MEHDGIVAASFSLARDASALRRLAAKYFPLEKPPGDLGPNVGQAPRKECQLHAVSCDVATAWLLAKAHIASSNFHNQRVGSSARGGSVSAQCCANVGDTRS